MLNRPSQHDAAPTDVHDPFPNERSLAVEWHMTPDNANVGRIIRIRRLEVKQCASGCNKHRDVA